jgi:hypothetical protein
MTTKKLLLSALASTLLLGSALTAPARAAFRIVNVNAGAYQADGSPADQAGGHPYIASTHFQLGTKGVFDPDGSVKDAVVDLPPGFVANPLSTPAVCTREQFYDRADEQIFDCPPSSQVGTAAIFYAGADDANPQPTQYAAPVFNLVAAHGSPATLAFSLNGVFATILPRLRTDGDYGLSAEVRNITQAPIVATDVELWGVPSDPSHDPERYCRGARANGDPLAFGCSSNAEPTPFLTNPANCSAGSLPTTLSFDSWEHPGDFVSQTLTTDRNGNPTAVTGCSEVPFNPDSATQQTTDQAGTPSGLDFELDMPTDGLLNAEGIAEAAIKRAQVTLPQGVTINPSAAEGLGACSPADFARESAASDPGAGCPSSSRVGSVRIDTPLQEEQAEGSLYLAQQDDPRTTVHGAENPFDSLLALYLVAKIPERGIVVKLAGKVEPDLKTGQLTTIFDNLPQLPFSKFHLKFREGGRAPLVSPPTCGTFTTQADFVPWSAADPNNPTPDEVAHTPSQFKITRGVGGGACPGGGLPPLHPNLTAGTLNNAAGSYSPFNIRLTRNDGEQEFTNFSIKLPPGLTGKLAGVPFCPDTAIAAAKAKTGGEELASPSCPKASEVGRTLVGAGVGSIQTYVPGKAYLAGPYNGSALSIAAITSAKVGPFDVGTVVIREALKVNPDTAEVFIDATGSDPIPHIIKGIPVHARDIRVYVDKPEFTLNPTSCKRTSTASTVLGSGLDFASSFDDNPITVTSPFQAADCASLGFKPKLDLRLIGGTKRGDNPKFKATLTARKGDANIGSAQVTLPHSEFLDNEHIKTICTRVQFAAGAVPGEKCPAASIHGYAKAITPLLDEPLQGPVFLRSSSHNLPDLVAALNSGKINIALDGRIDSVRGGRIRNTFEEVPDAPVTKFTLAMQGGKKGLLVNSTNLCKSTNRAIVAFTGQNGKQHNFNPALKPQCKGKAKKKRRARAKG